MIRIAVVGDVHDERLRLGRVLERLAAFRPGVALLAGDLGVDPPWRQPHRRTRRAAHDDSVRSVIGQVRGALACPVGFVPGNHDLSDAVTGLGAVNCDGRLVEIGGLLVAGMGGAGPARFGFPYEWDEAQAERVLEGLVPADGRLDVALCHTPPVGTGLDRTRRGQHVGSRAVRRWIATARPTLFVCGHIHEAWGVERVEGVPCINAGALGEPYGQEIAWIVEWSDGGPTAIRSFRGDEGTDARVEEWL